MVCETFSHGDSFVHRLDPRLRILACVGFAAVEAACRRWEVAAAGLALAMITAAAARLPAGPTARRMAQLNVFMLLLVMVVPFSAPGRPLFALGTLTYSREGLADAALIAVRGNAILLAVTALVSTLELVTLGHALERLHVPARLVSLLLFTARYVDLLHHERERLSRAMKVRCYRARFNAHSLRATGYLVGMLLVRSLNRAERVVAAMKCRGFDGTFHSMSGLSWSRRDTVFALGSCALLIVMAIGGWS